MDKHYTTSAVRRLKIIEGQIRGLQKMVARGAYCVEIIYQSLAIKKALSSFEDVVLKNHLETHVVQQMKSGKIGKAVREILSLYRLSKEK